MRRQRTGNASTRGNQMDRRRWSGEISANTSRFSRAIEHSFPVVRVDSNSALVSVISGGKAR